MPFRASSFSALSSSLNSVSFRKSGSASNIGAAIDSAAIRMAIRSVWSLPRNASSAVSDSVAAAALIAVSALCSSSCSLITFS